MIEPPPAPTTGVIRVVASTSGETLDADEYQIVVAGRLRENERMSIHLCELDDGGFTVELKMRSEGKFSEMTNTFDSFPAALRGVAKLCVTSADEIEASK